MASKRKEKGESEESSKKLKCATHFVDTKNVGEALLEDLKQRFQQLTYEKLKNKKTWLELICPNMFDRRCYWYMGRNFTAKVMKFIVDPPKHLDFYTGRGDGLIKYVTGTPGFGKTVSINTAVAYLYLQSIKDMETNLAAPPQHDTAAAPPLSTPIQKQNRSKAVQSQEQTQGGASSPGAKKKRWSPHQLGFTRHRFLLLSGDSFVEAPCEVLHAALVLAFIKDPQALASLEQVDYESEKDISRFLRWRTETVHIVVDDANSMDANPAKDSPALMNAKEVAWMLLRSLAQKNANVRVVVCASVRSALRKKILKESAEYRLGTGGYSEDEAVAYLMHRCRVTEQESRLRARRVRQRTGWVPRLLSHYLQSKSLFKQTRRSLLQNVSDALRSDNEREKVTEVLTAIAGGRLEIDLSDALDTACYFRGEDGKGHCLAPSLHDRTIAYVLQCAKDRKFLTAYEQISHFTQTVPGDSNLSRIGWNAEAAVLLALRLLRVRIPGVDVIIDPQVVRILDEKELTQEIMQGEAGKRVLYVPHSFNHAGVDVYYKCTQAVIVFQITVAGNPKKCHPKTEEVARRLFEGEKRNKVVVWNTTSLNSAIERPHAQRDFYRVYMSFGELHGLLDVIDRRVRELRRGKERDEKCPKCKQGLSPGNVVRCDFCVVRCDFCSDAYHKECVEVECEPWYCPDCRMAMGMDDDDEEGEDGDDDSDFEEDEDEDEDEDD